MANNNHNGRVTLAVLKNDMLHLKEHQARQNDKLDKVLQYLSEGDKRVSKLNTKIEKNSTAISYTWKVGGVIVTVIILTLSVLAYTR